MEKPGKVLEVFLPGGVLLHYVVQWAGAPAQSQTAAVPAVRPGARAPTLVPYAPRYTSHCFKSYAEVLVHILIGFCVLTVL